MFFHVLIDFKIKKEMPWRPFERSSTLKDRDSKRYSISFLKQIGQIAVTNFLNLAD